MHKDYLGDSVYIEIDESRSLVLTTENGLGPTNRIVLEPEVVQALITYGQRVGLIKPLK